MIKNKFTITINAEFANKFQKDSLVSYMETAINAMVDFYTNPQNGNKIDAKFVQNRTRKSKADVLEGEIIDEGNKNG